jgi:hypothetical protein
VSALRAMGAGETVGENAALQVATELALNLVGNRIGVIQLAASQRKPSLEVNLDRAIQQRALGPPPAIHLRAAGRDRQPAMPPPRSR